jgi:hypothetical protein
MSRSSILVIEFYCRGQSHIPFNLGYLATLRAAYPNKQINFYAEERHIEALEANGVASLSINLHIGPTHVSVTNPGSSIYERELSGHRCISFMLTAIERHDASFVGTFGVTPDLLRAIRWQWSKNLPHLDIVLHAPLMFLDQWRSKNPLRRYFDFPAEMSKRMPTNVRFITLENAIKKKLTERITCRQHDTFLLEHPINNGVQVMLSSGIDEKLERPLQVGFLGAANEAKGFSLFLELANKFACNGMKFHAVGWAGKNWKDSLGVSLATKPAREMLPRENYLAIVRTLDVVILPLEKKIYDWLASGTLIDCIEHGVPVIISTNNVINDIETRHGPIGVVCSKRSDFFDFFEKNSITKIKKINSEFLKNMSEIRAARNPEKLAEIYPGLKLR